MPPKGSAKKEKKEYTAEEVKKHNTSDDTWIILHGKVYDVTKFLDDHPGGPEVISEKAGEDATEEFAETFHSEKAQEMTEDYYIGDLKGYKGPAARAVQKSTSGAAASGGTNPLIYILPILAGLAAVYFKMST